MLYVSRPNEWLSCMRCSPPGRVLGSFAAHAFRYISSFALPLSPVVYMRVASHVRPPAERWAVR